MKLYDIPLEATEIESILAETYGELTPEIEERIAVFMADGKDKIESSCIVVKSLEDDAAVCRAEAKRLIDRANGLEKGADRLKGLMLYAVDKAFAGKLKTTKFTVWGQTSAVTTAFQLKPGTDIFSLAAQAPEFVRARDPEMDKLAMKEALKIGKPMPECVDVIENPGTRFLRIK
jgi:hypothetical protein